MTMSQETREELARIRARKRHLDPLGVIGGGPWRVLDYCTASEHNYLAAARGVRRGRGRGDSRCVCPRATALLADFYQSEHLRKRRMRIATLAATAPAPKPADRPALDLADEMLRRGVLEPSLRVPDLSAGLCSTEAGTAVVRRVEASTKHSHGDAAKAHRRMCEACPVRLACLANVIQRERKDFVDSWAGMYGGLWPKQRRDLLRAVEAMAS